MYMFIDVRDLKPLIVKQYLYLHKENTMTSYTKFTLRHEKLNSTLGKLAQLDLTMKAVRSIHNFFVIEFQHLKSGEFDLKGICSREMKESLIKAVTNYPEDLGFIANLDAGIIETHLRIIERSWIEFIKDHRNRPDIKSERGSQSFWNVKKDSINMTSDSLVIPGDTPIQFNLQTFDRSDTPTVYRVLKDYAGEYWVTALYEDVVEEPVEEYDQSLKIWSSTLQSMQNSYCGYRNSYNRTSARFQDVRAYYIRRAALSRLFKQQYLTSDVES